MSKSILEALYPQTGAVDDSDNSAAAVALDEIEKIASANNIDLNQFSDDELAAAVQEYMAQQGAGGGGTEKVASANGMQLPEGVDMEKVAAADFLGRVQARAMMDEFAQSQGVDKLAQFTPEVIDELASMHANDILEALGQIQDPQIAQEVAGREKVASLELPDEVVEVVANRTAEILDANGWDVGAINNVLAQHYGQN